MLIGEDSNFNSNGAHDATDKTFSSFFGGATITGKTGAAGAGETQELINLDFY